MRFKSRKAAVLVVLALLMVVQIVFSGISSNNASQSSAVNVADNSTVEGTDALEEDESDLITEEEVVSADLNVVYRSTLASTEVVDEFDGNIDNGDFNDNIVSYTCERLCVYAKADIKSDVVGVMYSGSEADIVEKGSEWTKITSGDVTGYIRNVDVLFGNEAETLAMAMGTREAKVTIDNLPVLESADASSAKIDTLSKGDTIDAYDEYNGYLMVISDKGYGYVDKECVSISYGLQTAITIEEEKQHQAEEAAAEAKRQAEEAAAAAAQAAAEKYSNVTSTSRGNYNATADEIHLLAAIVYWESGWEPATGQLAVANVVLNRVLSSRFSQNSISSVIYAPGQFSGVAENGAPSARFQAVLNMSNEELNVRGCYDAAITALSGQNNIGDMLFFISVKKANYAKYTSYTIINNHCFYVY